MDAAILLGSFLLLILIGTPVASSMRVRLGPRVSVWLSLSLAKRTVCGWV